MRNSNVNNQTKSMWDFWHNRSQTQRNLIKASPLIAVGLAALGYFVMKQYDFLRFMKREFIHVSLNGINPYTVSGGGMTSASYVTGDKKNPCLPGYSCYQVVVSEKEDVLQKAIELFNQITSNGRDITSFYGFEAHTDTIKDNAYYRTGTLEDYEATKHLRPLRNATFTICRQTFRARTQQIYSKFLASVKDTTKGLWE